MHHKTKENAEYVDDDWHDGRILKLTGLPLVNDSETVRKVFID